MAARSESAEVDGVISYLLPEGSKTSRSIKMHDFNSKQSILGKIPSSFVEVAPIAGTGYKW